ncbi:MAG: type II toxin-antitoxin system Phd/YefM family antitoxin [Deltaproteobacteria bacterium]|nr:type II toxin-antitoxin system Phd/YefM family antitoxin [Deltaproteobacteria bacterium]
MREVTLGVSEFKATCLSVLKNVRRTGRRVLITRRGEAIAMVCPPPPAPKKASWLGSFGGSASICGDIVSPAAGEHDWEVETG